MFGAGIENLGTLTLTNSTISGNHVLPPDGLAVDFVAGGGGIFNDGIAMLDGTTVSDNVAGTGFSPSISWLHAWTPRPEDTGTWADLMNTLDPSLGIHAAFLNYSTDNDFEIGLGATFALWQDRLQFGYGYNLQAESSAEGRTYFFIGSSLISLLQDFSSMGSTGGGRRD